MPFIDDDDLDLEYGGAFNTFEGGLIGDLTIAPVNTKSIDDSQVKALENSAAQLADLQRAREVQLAAEIAEAARLAEEKRLADAAAAAAAAAEAARLAEERKRNDARTSILNDIDVELGALSSLITRLNSIITLASPYADSQFTDVASTATSIVNSANALKTTISNLVASLNTAKSTATNARTSL